MGSNVISLPANRIFKCEERRLDITCNNLTRSMKMNQNDASIEIIQHLCAIKEEKAKIILESWESQKDHIIEELKRLPEMISQQPYNNFLYTCCKIFDIDLSQAINIFIRFREKPKH